MPVKGIERVKRQMHFAFKDISEKKTYAGIYAILLQGSQLSLLMTPQDTGFLANSLYKPRVEGTTGQVGFMAEYAQWVHEMPGTLKGYPRGHFGRTRAGVDFGGGTERGNYWDPNGEPHWLTKGFEDLKPSISHILEAAYRV